MTEFRGMPPGRGCALCVPDGEFNGRPFLVCTEKCTAEIRGLSIRQPWAWAITCAGKKVENRSRPVSYRGLLAIHASKTRPLDADLGNPLILEAIADQEFEIDKAASVLGAIVAVAELVGCHPHCRASVGPDACDSVWAPLCSSWAAGAQWHWQLASVCPLPEPVPCRGSLGLWRLPVEVEMAVRGQLEVPGA